VRSLALYPSASKIRAASVCVAPWSLGLPRVDEAGPDAERGRLLHGGAEAIASGHEVPFALAPAGSEGASAHAILNHVAVMLEADRDAALDDAGPHGSSWWVEQGVQWRALDLHDEARLVTREPGEEGAGWFSGTADLAYVRADGVLVVVDWKFGPRQRWTSERAHGHWQGWTLALALTTALKISAARPGDVVARFEARYVDEEGVLVDGVDITQRELDEHAATLAQMAQRLENGEGPRVGAACGDCAARAACPAWQALGVAALESIGAVLPPDLLAEPPTTPDQAAMAWHALERIEEAAPVLRRNIESFVRVLGEARKGATRAIPLGMGLELRARPTAGQMRALDTPDALATAAEVLGVEETAFTTPTTNVERLMGAWAARTGKTKSGADAKKAKAQLEARGVLRRGAPGVRLEVLRAEDEGEEE
jgi:hypothetical protein